MRLVGFLSELFTLAGNIIVAYAVLSLHDRIREEQKVDDNTYHAMARERYIIILGIAMVFAGFALSIWERVLG